MARSDLTSDILQQTMLGPLASPCLHSSIGYKSFVLHVAVASTVYIQASSRPIAEIFGGCSVQCAGILASEPVQLNITTALHLPSTKLGLCEAHMRQASLSVKIPKRLGPRGSCTSCADTALVRASCSTQLMRLIKQRKAAPQSQCSSTEIKTRQ
jgi:hypothetical protein